MQILPIISNVIKKQGSECWFKFSETWTVCSKTTSLQSLSWHNSSYQSVTYHLCFRGQSDIHCSQSRRKEKERIYTFMQVRACWVNKSPQKAQKSKMECSHASTFFFLIFHRTRFSSIQYARRKIFQGLLTAVLKRTLKETIAFSPLKIHQEHSFLLLKGQMLKLPAKIIHRINIR